MHTLRPDRDVAPRDAMAFPPRATVRERAGSEVAPLIVDVYLRSVTTRSSVKARAGTPSGFSTRLAVQQRFWNVAAAAPGRATITASQARRAGGTRQGVDQRAVRTLLWCVAGDDGMPRAHGELPHRGVWRTGVCTTVTTRRRSRCCGGTVSACYSMTTAGGVMWGVRLEVLGVNAVGRQIVVEQASGRRTRTLPVLSMRSDTSSTGGEE